MSFCAVFLYENSMVNGKKLNSLKEQSSRFNELLDIQINKNRDLTDAEFEETKINIRHILNKVNRFINELN